MRRAPRTTHRQFGQPADLYNTSIDTQLTYCQYKISRESPRKASLLEDQGRIQLAISVYLKCEEHDLLPSQRAHMAASSWDLHVRPLTRLSNVAHPPQFRSVTTCHDVSVHCHDHGNSGVQKSSTGGYIWSHLGPHPPEVNVFRKSEAAEIGEQSLNKPCHLVDVYYGTHQVTLRNIGGEGICMGTLWGVWGPPQNITRTKAGGACRPKISKVTLQSVAHTYIWTGSTSICLTLIRSVLLYYRYS